MTISFEQFQSLDLRTVRIESVRDHPNADRLYLLEVTDGTERRQFVAGIKGHYTPEDLTEENVDYIRTMITREAVNNRFGRAAMYRVLLDSDPEFQEVLSILKDAPTLKKMFAYAEARTAIKEASID